MAYRTDGLSTFTHAASLPRLDRVSLSWQAMRLESMQLERDLELARRHGRWLSDEEQVLVEQQRVYRRKLVALLVVSVVVPPLWPLALVLSLGLLFPVTTRRIALGLGVGVVLLGLLSTALVTALVVAVLMALF